MVLKLFVSKVKDPETSTFARSSFARSSFFRTSLQQQKKNKDAVKLAKEIFTGALFGAEVLMKVKKVMKKRGYTPENTLYAQSICPDEINHEEGDMTNLLIDHIGEVFHMGGLAGIPFTGKTGFGAFSHHVPDGGHCFVLMAPHVGISDTNRLGHYSRDGQSKEGHSCGAAVGAFGACCKCSKDNELPNLLDDPFDYQMNYIITEMYKRHSQITTNKKTENDQQAAVAHATYDIAKQMLDKVVHTNFGDDHSTLIVLTGVQINMPRPYDDMFQPLTFEIHYKNGTVLDLFETTFGHPPPKLLIHTDTTTTTNNNNNNDDDDNNSDCVFTA